MGGHEVRPSTQTGQVSIYPVVLVAAFGLFLSTEAFAGGFEVQQSAYFQGMSFAGVATGGPSLASIAWNPATSSSAASGLTMELSYALVLPDARLTVANPDVQLPPPGPDHVDIGQDSCWPRASVRCV